MGLDDAGWLRSAPTARIAGRPAARGTPPHRIYSREIEPEESSMRKNVKESTGPTDLKVWCEGCCIRIAPNEERIESSGRSYHPRCRPKPHRAADRYLVRG